MSPCRSSFPLVYGRLHDLAQTFMRRQPPSHTLQPTALMGELYLRLANAIPPELKSREHFYSLCARTMRWILTDHARTRQAEKRQVLLERLSPRTSLGLACAIPTPWTWIALCPSSPKSTSAPRASWNCASSSAAPPPKPPALVEGDTAGDGRRGRSS